jgi:anti-sigma-K factor RskA
MTHDEAHELFGLHALGALEATDAEALAAHLAHCAACRAEAADFERTGAELGRLAPSLIPSTDITRRILRAADAGRSFPAAPSPAGGATRAIPVGRRSGLLRLAAGFGIAAMIACLVVSQWTLRTRLDHALATIARGGDLLRFIASPDVRTVTLASQYSPDARAFVSYDRNSGRLVVVAFGVPPPPAGQVYEVWAISDGIRPAAVFSPDAHGGALVRDWGAPERADAPLFAITLEPEPGVSEPTGRMLFLGGQPAKNG